jgi:hypothetical protein
MGREQRACVVDVRSQHERKIIGFTLEKVRASSRQCLQKEARLEIRNRKTKPINVLPGRLRHSARKNTARNEVTPCCRRKRSHPALPRKTNSPSAGSPV